MALAREVSGAGTLQEIDLFVDLLGQIDPKDMDVTTRCNGGWTGLLPEWLSVADVAAHFVGSATELVEGRFEGFGAPETVARVVEERRGTSPADLANELRVARRKAEEILGIIDDEAWNGPAPGEGFGYTLGDGVEGVWTDAYVHALDIEAALGRPESRGLGLLGTVSYLATILTGQGWEPVTLALKGLPQFPVSGGSSRQIVGDPLDFILAVTDRRPSDDFELQSTVAIW